MKIPGGLQYWRPDEVAECLPVGEAMYRKLWTITAELERAGKAVPLGGDGTDGTIEMPPEPDAFKGGKMGAAWAKLTPAEQEEVATAFLKEHGA